MVFLPPIDLRFVTSLLPGSGRGFFVTTVKVRSSEPPDPLTLPVNRAILKAYTKKNPMKTQVKTTKMAPVGKVLPTTREVRRATIRLTGVKAPAPVKAQGFA